jgi:hypothetical protein
MHRLGCVVKTRHVRRTYSILRKSNLNYYVASRNAIRIQAAVRGYLARKEVALLTDMLAEKLATLLKVVVMLQRVRHWRQRTKERKDEKALLDAVLKVQATFRGMVVRKTITNEQPELAEKIRVSKEHLHYIEVQFFAIRKLQAWVRGFRARKYVEARRAMSDQHMNLMRDSYRRHELRRKIGNHHSGDGAFILKLFYDALLSMERPPEPEKREVENTNKCRTMS